MYVLLVRVFGAHEKKWLAMYLIIGWGEKHYTVIPWPYCIAVHVYFLKKRSSNILCMLI